MTNIRVPYENMKFHYVTSHYDYHITGTCIHNGRIALFHTQDETDYEAMTESCPCCKPNGTDDWKDCHCENAPDLYCIITELPFHKRIWYRMRKYFHLLWFLRHWGIQGITYWKRWAYK
jgi:hypothetical protein